MITEILSLMDKPPRSSVVVVPLSAELSTKPPTLMLLLSLKRSNTFVKPMPWDFGDGVMFPLLISSTREEGISAYAVVLIEKD